VGGFNTFTWRHNFEIADKIISASKFECVNVQHVFSVSKQRIEVVPHGVSHIRTVQNKKPGDTKDCISSLSFGYLIELKGVQHALRAVSKLEHELGKHFAFAIIGEGDYKPDLVALSKKMNKRIQYRGSRFYTETNCKRSWKMLISFCSSHVQKTTVSLLRKLYRWGPRASSQRRQH
jgi:glycosyltransferase involved in cell wall biosynthesis